MSLEQVREVVRFGVSSRASVNQTCHNFPLGVIPLDPSHSNCSFSTYSFAWGCFLYAPVFLSFLLMKA